jgi:hypothetical protein
MPSLIERENINQINLVASRCLNDEHSFRKVRKAKKTARTSDGAGGPY